jgi:hypothetical protein
MTPKKIKEYLLQYDIPEYTIDKISQELAAMIKGKAVIPSEAEFVEYGLTICAQVYGNSNGYEYPIKAKYKQWLDDNWHDGHRKPIKNWQNKLNNVIPFLVPVKMANSLQDVQRLKIPDRL